MGWKRKAEADRQPVGGSHSHEIHQSEFRSRASISPHFKDAAMCWILHPYYRLAKATYMSTGSLFSVQNLLKGR